MDNQLKGLNSKVRKQVITQSMNYTIHNGSIYDNETGEYLGDQYEAPRLIPKRDKVKSEYYIKRNTTLIQQHSKDNGGFVFALFKFNSDIAERLPLLNKKDIARLIYLATYTHYDTGRLQKGDGTVITTINLSSVVKLSNKRCIEFCDRLIESNVISVTANKEIIMSREFFVKGSMKKSKNNDIKYNRLYKNSIRNIFESANNRELAHLALIYTALPYINLYHNIISYNPNEIDATLLQPMDTKVLANKLGYSDYSKLTKALNKITINDNSVFTYYVDVNDRRKKNVIVNSFVLFGGSNDEQLTNTQAFFSSIVSMKN